MWRCDQVTNVHSLSDLRESGAIEQDADLVIFIHRPEYYGIDVDEEGNSLKGIAEIIVAKHRNGPVGDVQLKFVREYAKFVDLDDTLAMVEDDENGFIITSKMNHDAGGRPSMTTLGRTTVLMNRHLSRITLKNIQL